MAHDSPKNPKIFWDSATGPHWGAPNPHL
jgi:hypothetical protein